jgi:hypothetical protein
MRGTFHSFKDGVMTWTPANGIIGTWGIDPKCEVTLTVGGEAKKNAKIADLKEGDKVEISGNPAQWLKATR